MLAFVFGVWERCQKPKRSDERPSTVNVALFLWQHRSRNLFCHCLFCPAKLGWVSYLGVLRISTWLPWPSAAFANRPSFCENVLVPCLLTTAESIWQWESPSRHLIQPVSLHTPSLDQRQPSEGRRCCAVPLARSLASP